MISAQSLEVAGEWLCPFPPKWILWTLRHPFSLTHLRLDFSVLKLHIAGSDGETPPRASRLWIGRYALWRCRIGLARLQYLATDSGPWGCRAPRHACLYLRRGRTPWRNCDSMAQNGANRRGHLGRSLSYVCIAVGALHCCQSPGLRFLGQFFRTVFACVRSVDRLCDGG